MIILGLNAFHADASACLIQDGRLIAAAEEERFKRVKHFAGLPVEAVRYCLSEAAVSFSDVDIVAINQDNNANAAARVKYVLSNRPELSSIYGKLKVRRSRRNVINQIASGLKVRAPDAKLENVEHHLAHLASANLQSGFEQNVSISMDGFGDFASAAWAECHGGDVSIEKRVHFPHSMGIFYQAITQFLGFPNYGDEFKVMGLSAYGTPKYRNALRGAVNCFGDGTFTLSTMYFNHTTNQINFEWDDGAPSFDKLYKDWLEGELGPARSPHDGVDQRHADIAASAQQIYEEVLINMCVAAHRFTGLTDLTLAGGCANNSVANGKITTETPFKRIHVHPAPSDSGGAVGAALVAWHKHKDTAVEGGLPYLGPAFSDAQVASDLIDKGQELADAGISISHLSSEADLVQNCADALAEGKIVGWFQGRMEWGPRALGNRSILCDPRRHDARDLINQKIKMREEFRPFAPSVLAERAHDWFSDSRPSPFMSEVREVIDEKRDLIPAVVHVDGTARVQTVSREGNALFYNLITAFAERTDVPMLLNTSLNSGEPIVCKPLEAINLFQRTRLDELYIGKTRLVRTCDESDEGQRATKAASFLL